MAPRGTGLGPARSSATSSERQSRTRSSTDLSSKPTGACACILGANARADEAALRCTLLTALRVETDDAPLLSQSGLYAVVSS
jgi:hypothetical protein